MRLPRWLGIFWIAEVAAGSQQLLRQQQSAQMKLASKRQQEMCVNSTDPTCIVPLALASTKLPPVAYDEEAYNKSAAREMTIVVSVSRWEQCYLSEWLEYHFALGVTRVYLLPVFGYPLINHPPPGTRLDPLVVQSVKKDDVMRNFTWNDLRVHVLCEVGGHPGDCKDPAAISYAEGGRQHQAKLLVEEIAPRHAGGWIGVIDLDEYLTVPNAARTLPGVLESYNRRRATYVTINTLTYGANQVEINPAVASNGSNFIVTEDVPERTVSTEALLSVPRASTISPIKDDSQVLIRVSFAYVMQVARATRNL